jgi:phage-related minor tail protein
MNDYLEHHGILGMKWGIRRFRNYDGTLTAKGKARERRENKKNRAERSKKIKKAIVIGMAVAGAGLVAYGAKKYFDVSNNLDKEIGLASRATKQIINDNEDALRDIAKRQAANAKAQAHVMQTSTRLAKAVVDIVARESKSGGAMERTEEDWKTIRAFNKMIRDEAIRQGRTPPTTFDSFEEFDAFMKSDEPLVL